MYMRRLVSTPKEEFRGMEHEEIVDKINRIYDDIIEECKNEDPEILTSYMEQREDLVGTVVSMIKDYLNPPVKKDVIKEALLENMEKYVSASTYHVYGNEPRKKALLSITEHFVDQLAIKHLVGIQPMAGPVGLIYSLGYKEEDSDERKISMEVVSRTVEACSRKTNIKIVPEPTGLISEETCLRCGRELAQEVYEEVRQDLSALAAKEDIDASKIFKNENEITQNEIQTLIINFNYCANEIARKTRRGSGNFLIVSEILAKILSEAKTIFKIDPLKTCRDYGYLNYVGTLHNVIDIYCDYTLKSNKAIMGYKGRHGETDTGFFYCPYVVAMGNEVVDPDTFKPLISFITRYGKVETRKITEETSEDGSTTMIRREPSNYYTEITFENFPVYDLETIKFIKGEEEIIKEIEENIKEDSFEATMKEIMER